MMEINDTIGVYYKRDINTWSYFVFLHLLQKHNNNTIKKNQDSNLNILINVI